MSETAVNPEDSNEGFSQAYRPIENPADKLKHRISILAGAIPPALNCLVSLPVSTVIDAVSSRTATLLKSIEAVKTSDHESAHLLFSILNDEPVVQMALCPYGEYTGSALGLPRGFVSNEYAPVFLKTSNFVRGYRDFVDPYALDVSASRRSSEKIVKDIFMLLAGEAVNFENSREWREEMGHRFLWLDADGGDISTVRKILETSRYDKVKAKVFNLMIHKIVPFLKDPLARRVIDIFSLELLDKRDIHAGGGRIAPLMVDLLEKNGISREEFGRIQLKYEEMVNQTVREIDGLLENCTE